MRGLLFFSVKLEVATLLDDLIHEAEIEIQTDVENKYMNTKGDKGIGVRRTGKLGWTHIHY